MKPSIELVKNSVECLLEDAIEADKQSGDQRENWRLGHVVTIAMFFGFDIRPTKRCPKCRVTKDREQYSPSHFRVKQGICRSCARAEAQAKRGLKIVRL